MIELALAFTDKDGSYATHATAVLSSIFCNTNSQMNIHILHDESLSEEGRNKLADLTSSHHHTINFHQVALPKDMVDAAAGVTSIENWTQGSMYRLLLPAVIPADRVIYLDCDVLVNMDILELWNTDLKDYYLGAIKDQGIVPVAEIVAACGLNPETYFNSGVILFEINNIRQKTNWYEEMLNFLRNFPHTAMPDQDILNHVFGGNYLELDIRFNTFTEGIEPYNKIAHFAGTAKAWNVGSPGYQLYQDYLNKATVKVNEFKNEDGTREKTSKNKTDASRKHHLKRKVRKSAVRRLWLVRKNKRLKMRKRSMLYRTGVYRGRSVKRRTRKLLVHRTRRFHV